MGSLISINEKRDFLQWFLHGHELKRRECAWLLNYILSYDSLLEKVHFVEKAEFCPKALIISSKDVDQIPFSYHKNQYVTMDAERSFHDIRLHPEEELYVQLNFEGALGCPQYISVLEENPYLPNQNEERQYYHWLAGMVTDEALRHFQIKRLKADIDQALDNYDRYTFNELSSKLQQYMTDKSGGPVES